MVATGGFVKKPEERKRTLSDLRTKSFASFGDKPTDFKQLNLAEIEMDIGFADLGDFQTFSSAPLSTTASVSLPNGLKLTSEFDNRPKNGM